MISLPSGPLLFDTGIYIRFSRGEDYPWLGHDTRVFQRTILTAVVAAELYAGTHNHREKHALDKLCQAHRALGHFSRSRKCWTKSICPKTLRARRSRMPASIQPAAEGDEIAVEAARAGATLVTENVGDFARWRSILTSAKMTLKVFRPS